MKTLRLVAAGASLLLLERVFRALGPALAKLIRDDRRKAKELMDRVSRELLKVKPDLENPSGNGSATSKPSSQRAARSPRERRLDERVLAPVSVRAPRARRRRNARRAAPSRERRNGRPVVGSAAVHLVVIRHAIAKDKESWARTGRPDELRSLTTRGRGRMRRNARGLARLVGTIDFLASSPLVRAMQTAEIVADAFGDLEISAVPSLSPGTRPEDVATWIGRSAGAHSTIALVGHEPALGELVSWFLAAAAARSSLCARAARACSNSRAGAWERDAALEPDAQTTASVRLIVKLRWHPRCSWFLRRIRIHRIATLIPNTETAGGRLH